MSEIYRGQRHRVFRVPISEHGPLIIKTRIEDSSAGEQIYTLRNERRILELLQGVDGCPELIPQNDDKQGLKLKDFNGIALSQANVCGSPDLEFFLEFAECLANIIAQIHGRGVIHKDINPSNILFRAHDRKLQVIDFDLATTFAEEHLEFVHHSHLLGTLASMSPELTGRMNRSVDSRADLYSLGATLYTLAVGVPPFDEPDALSLIHAHLARLPQPPLELAPWLPPCVSDLILTLLAKEPDERYQSAAGLAHDLGLLRLALAEGSPLHQVALRQHDHPLSLRPPSRLCGRVNELAALMDAFARVSMGGMRAVFVGGYSGVGKTSLVQEIHKPVTLSRGWFIGGKFEQLQQHRPFLAPIQSLRQMCQLLLAEPDSEIERYRLRILSAIGSSAAALFEIVPEFQALLGSQPAAPHLEPRESQARLRNLLVALIHQVAAPEHPLVLFLDDLQWADQPSLDFIRDLLDETALNGLLFIGAYRDNEIDELHPLSRFLREQVPPSCAATVMTLPNLTVGDIGALLAQMLRMPQTNVGALAKALYAKAGGNPFFTIELLNALFREGILRSNPQQASWVWDDAVIAAYATSANVVEFLVAGMSGLSEGCVAALVAAACLGTSCSLGLLASAMGMSLGEVAESLEPALERGILVTQSALALHQRDAAVSLRFCHDRMQQAVYQLYDDARRTRLHLNIARRFVHTRGDPASPLRTAEHYAMAVPLLAERSERILAQKLFLYAATRASQAGSFAVAERYLRLGIDLLPEEPWKDDRDTAFALHAELHLVLYSQSRNDEADAVFSVLAAHATSPVRLVNPACVQISNLANRTRYADAIRLACSLLEQLGMPVPTENTSEHLGHEVDRFYTLVTTGALERLTSAPELTDELLLGAAKLMNRVGTTAYFCQPLLSRWFQMRLVRLWMEQGYCASMLNPTGYLSCSTISCRNDYATGYRIGRIAMETGLNRDGGMEIFRTQHCFGLFTSHWFEPLEEGLRHARAAFDGLLRSGSLDFACFTFRTSLAATLDVCDDLGEMEKEIALALNFTRKTGNLHAEQSYVIYRQFVRSLRGTTAFPGSFNDVDFTEQEHLAKSFGNNYAQSYANIYRALSAYLFNDAAALVRHIEAASGPIANTPGVYPTALANMLASLACISQLRAGEQTGHAVLQETLARNQLWLAARASDAPMNFGHLHALVEAERLDVQGHLGEALLVFERAMRTAQANQRVWHYAMITERAGLCHMRHGLEHSGRALLQQAHEIYGRWGAVGKAQAMRGQWPFIDSRRMESTGSGHRDDFNYEGILRAFQTLASETSLPKLVARLTQLLGQMTGATDVRLLVLDDEANWVLEGGRRGEVSLERTPLAEALQTGMIASSVWRLALKTQLPIVSDDAVIDSRFSTDPHFSGMAVCSLLAMPVSVQGRIKALLTLENRLLRAAFSDSSLELLSILCGQLAISIENTRLYQTLQNKVRQRTQELSEANSKLRRLSASDGLTGLANRRMFDETFQGEWNRALRHRLPLAVLLLDVDQFKAYNDQYGHLAGDACLKRVAQALQIPTQRAGELVARYGGEEFVILLPGLSGDAAYKVAHRVRASIQDLKIAHARDVQTGVVTVSIGVAARIPRQGEVASELLKEADASLYRAKEQGRNCVVWTGSDSLGDNRNL